MAESYNEAKSVMSNEQTKQTTPALTREEEPSILETSEQLRRKRSAAKGAVTKKMKELTKSKLSFRSLSEANN